VALLRAEALWLLEQISEAQQEWQHACVVLACSQPTQANLEARRRRQLDALAQRL
jgi:hypothetical protein